MQAVTPRKSITVGLKSNKKGAVEELPKHLSPLAGYLSMNPLKTPISKHQLQYLTSPISTRKDLFMQLLQTQRNSLTPSSILAMQSSNQEQWDYDVEECDDEIIEESISFEDDEMDHFEEESSGCIRKRKRKSTFQIRLLKQQLGGEVNWTKDKIGKMAEVTGLSQSQVYKWCWDQKKKNQKTKQHSNRHRKIIKKDVEYRQHVKGSKKYDEDEELEFYATKIKIQNANSEENNPETDKKINKKLVFH